MRKDFDENLLWNLTKIIIKDLNFTSIKLRKDKDFSSSALCTSKNFSKIKAWFASNTVDYDTLSLFFSVSGDDGSKKEIMVYLKDRDADKK